MRRIWNEIGNHWLSSALFMTCWLALTFLNFILPRAARESLLQLHFALPVLAGCLVCWWRGHGPEKITGGMLAGAGVLTVDCVLDATRDFLENLTKGRRLLRALPDEEFVVFLTLAAVIGAVLGLIGASVVAALRRQPGRWQKPSPGSLPMLDSTGMPAAEAEGETSHVNSGATMPRQILLVAGGVVLGVTAMMALVVLPAMPEGGPANSYAVMLVLNVLVCIALFAPVSRWSNDAGKAMVLMAGFVSFAFASFLLAAAGSTWALRPGSRAVAIVLVVCTVAELGVGVLAFVAAFRGRTERHAA